MTEPVRLGGGFLGPSPCGTYEVALRQGCVVMCWCVATLQGYHEGVMTYYLLPRYPDGRGCAYLHCTPEAESRFRFSAIAAKYGLVDHWEDASPEDLAAARYAKRGDAYRIALPTRYPSGAFAKVRFRLSKGAPKATLEVIGRHLDEERIPWLYFTDDSGTRIRGHRFTSHRMISAA